MAVAQGAAASAQEVADDIVERMNTMPNRLRWILDCTMGSVGDFEYRRNEMAMLSGTSARDIDDDAVVASFYDSVASEQGFMRECAHLTPTYKLFCGINLTRATGTCL